MNQKLNALYPLEPLWTEGQGNCETQPLGEKGLSYAAVRAKNRVLDPHPLSSGASWWLVGDHSFGKRSPKSLKQGIWSDLPIPCEVSSTAAEARKR